MSPKESDNDDDDDDDDDVLGGMPSGNRQIDRQTDRQADRPTDRQTDRQTKTKLNRTESFLHGRSPPCPYFIFIFEEGWAVSRSPWGQEPQLSERFFENVFCLQKRAKS